MYGGGRNCGGKSVTGFGTMYGEGRCGDFGCYMYAKGPEELYWGIVCRGLTLSHARKVSSRVSVSTWHELRWSLGGILHTFNDTLIPHAKL